MVINIWKHGEKKKKVNNWKHKCSNWSSAEMNKNEFVIFDGRDTYVQKTSLLPSFFFWDHSFTDAVL